LTRTWGGEEARKESRKFADPEKKVGFQPAWRPPAKNGKGKMENPKGNAKLALIRKKTGSGLPSCGGKLEPTFYAERYEKEYASIEQARFS